MTALDTLTTWDGQSISPEKPHGTTVVVYRQDAGRLEFLILHRAHHGPDYEGDWAWTPPSGARFPGEEVEACARRELLEETGLILIPTLTNCGTEDWWVYMAEAPREAVVRLSEEHDRFEWMSVEVAVQKCAPESVTLPLQKAAPQIFQKKGVFE